MTDKSLAGKIVLVTGASRGIGYAAAREAGRRGAHVVAIARTVGGLEELDDEIRQAGGSTTLVPFDLTDGDAIDRLGAALFERWGRLDAFIGNAAVMSALTPLAHLDVKDFTRAFAVNVTANYRLIRSLDLLLRRSEAGRVLFLTSGVARSLPPYWGHYAASKAALEALALTYSKELGNTGIKVNLFDPGPLRTALRSRGWPGEDATLLPSPSVVAPDIMRMISADYAETGTLFDYTTGATTKLG